MQSSKTDKFFNKPLFQAIIKALCALGLLFAAVHGFADGDLLSGTTEVAVKTFNGSGKILIYLAEFVMAVGCYIKTRNMMAFIGILVVAFFITTIATHFIGA